METCDTEFVAAAPQDFIKRSPRRDSPSSSGSTPPGCTSASTSRSSLGQAGRWQSFYHDVMIDHDKHVGTDARPARRAGHRRGHHRHVLTDNGPHMNTWPDAAMTPFRNEKNSNWEGAYRVPAMVRWPGKIKAGVGLQRDHQHTDWLPTLLARPASRTINAKAEAGPPGRRQALQGAHRRLQLPALLDRPGGQGAAPGLHLLLRRRRPDRAALRQLEVRLCMEQRVQGTVA
jgi:arylsulfatase A-like enzyme